VLEDRCHEVTNLLFCTSYYQSKTDVEATTLSWLLGTDDPIDDSPLPDIKDCSIPEIQTIVSRVQAILMFLDAGSCKYGNSRRSLYVAMTNVTICAM
jgi:hypothetical protein